MNLLKYLSTLILCIAMFGCSPKHNENKSVEAKVNKPGGLLTSAQEKGLKDAKQVEGVLQDANDKRLKQIDEQ